MGYDDAFGAIHDRYRQRLLAYTRQMLGPSRSDAEDVLQDVFLRAYGALRNDNRPVTLRAWLYRVAHNRCIDHLRRPLPPAAEIYELSRTPTHDPQAETVRREDLRRLVQDVQRLPEQQRSALLMRELDGLTYAELADALDTSVPAIKSLLVRARVGLVEAEEARDTACVDIRADLVRSHGRGVRTSGRSRRHLRDCDGCRAYRQGLRGVDEGLAALVPGRRRAARRRGQAAGDRRRLVGRRARAQAPEPAAPPPWPAAPRPPPPPRRRSSPSSAAPPSSAEARPRCASTSTPVAPSGHAVRHVRKAAPHVGGGRGRADQGAGSARHGPGARRRARGAQRAQGRPAATRSRRRPPSPPPSPATGSVAAPAPPAPVTAAPEEAQTGGAMAPDEDSMPDPSGTGAVGAPVARREPGGARADDPAGAGDTRPRARARAPGRRSTRARRWPGPRRPADRGRARGRYRRARRWTAT